MRAIEEELFVLSEINRELDVENRRRIGFLRGERTRLANQLLLRPSLRRRFERAG